VRGVAPEPVTYPTASGWVAGPCQIVGFWFSIVSSVSDVERMTPRPLIDKTLFLASSTFETPPSFLWSVKTQSV
jgi:hypothetical protein